MKAKGKDRNVGAMIGTIIIAVLFLGSTIGFVFLYSRGNTGEAGIYKYDGYKFIKTEQGWQTSTQFGGITTAFLPKDTLEIECDCPSLNYQTIQAQKVYVIAITGAEINAANEFLRNIAFNKIQRACLPEDANAVGCENLPLRNCSDANTQTKVLIFKESASIESKSEEQGMSKFLKARVSFNNDCLTIKGEDLIKASDKAIYKVFGVITN